MKRLNLIGHRFGRLTVIEFSHKDKRRKIYWLCKCDCGQSKFVRACHLVANKIRSCGCLEIESRIDHGMNNSPEYNSWRMMIQRCTNPKRKEWKNYGGRGITVCDRWLKFENFFIDMGDRPKHTTLDRRDNDGNYSPDNCRWATKAEQNYNKRPSRIKNI